MIDLREISAAVAAHGPVVRVVVAEAKGSAPREEGAAMLVWAGGQSGTIGGGTLEFEAARKARAQLSQGEARRIDRLALGPALGQCCGGAVTLVSEIFGREILNDLESNDIFARPTPGAVPERPLAVARMLADARGQGVVPRAGLVSGWLVEPVRPRAKPVWIYGAGHVGRAIVAMLAPIPGFAITWVDIALERFPEGIPEGVTALPAQKPAQALRLAPKDACHLILSYSHTLDLELCHAALEHGFGFAGLIGSKTKWARFRARLGQMGHRRDEIDRITCPIGMKELGKHPQAIAVGVVAGLLKDAAEKKTNRGTPEHGDEGKQRHALGD